MGHNRGQVGDSLSDKCTTLIQNNLTVVKVEVEILTVNEHWSRFLLNITSFIEKQN